MEAIKQTKYDAQFDAQYRYDQADLGCVCAVGRTVFKLWSPEAERVELSLYRDDRTGAYDTLPLTREDRGVWSLTMEGDLHGVYYDYHVTASGQTVRTADPYALVCGLR